jgi:hypothetical protein
MIRGRSMNLPSIKKSRLDPLSQPETYDHQPLTVINPIVEFTVLPAGLSITLIAVFRR